MRPNSLESNFGKIAELGQAFGVKKEKIGSYLSIGFFPLPYIAVFLFAPFFIKR